MSHQKVRASEKWGFYLFADERFAWLKEGVETVQENLTHDQVYLAILNRWENGDFSKADRDHNTIWELQGGTVGRASGVLRPEEEEENIDSAYEN
ncbi:DUF6241 domain-containing protein [Aquisalibacillus elongatus]|uniref:DUF6241 domain-containing protein n=1 Tax=Aquisalibacillus elongatus TaxID=485577 RepID=UPI001474E1BC|nr:DUF6241 domain-containing protein [Aquisalibacillus elongatus]